MVVELGNIPSVSGSISLGVGEPWDMETIPPGFERDGSLGPKSKVCFASRLYPGQHTEMIIEPRTIDNGKTIHYEAFPNKFNTRIRFASMSLKECVNWCNDLGRRIDRVLQEDQLERERERNEMRLARKKGRRV